ncbi:hypothetical protein JTE90_008802 [Oedothorax gibbosus]|uniref:Ig-like domain-containing protein n=1 Tax=Oedothorax gibbosus TaxID=931172 RepID=A0AAV6V6M1_9ARAC|nr:hypothetical protein JTE90_008802 [Oedothorax gibbosus]
MMCFGFHKHSSCVPGIKLKTTNIFSEGTEYPEMHAVIGSTVSLPCNLSPPSPDDSISLVLWYRLDLPNPIYTLDARSANGEAKHFASKVLGGRGSFNPSSQRPTAASLTLEKTTEADAGEYRCRVDFRRGRTLSWLVKLSVIVPTNKLLIKDKDNKTLSGTIGPHKEGSALTLICESYGGLPLPTVTWRRGARTDTTDQTTFVDTEKEIVRTELFIDNLKREDLLTDIVCSASNTNLTTPITSSVKLDISLNPSDVLITTRQGSISAGERIEFTCVSKGSRPPARITWWKDGKDLKRYATDEVNGDVTTSKLFLSPTSEDHDKILTCRAENPVNADSALEDQLNLNVYYAPIVTATLAASQSNELIREGGDVYLECLAQANPPVTQVRWRFKTKTLHHDPNNGVSMRNSTLVLQNVGRNHRGRYRCLAANLEGESASDDVNLRVQYSPVCVDQRTTIRVWTKNYVSCSVPAPQRWLSWIQQLDVRNCGHPVVQQRWDVQKRRQVHSKDEAGLRCLLLVRGRGACALPCSTVVQKNHTIYSWCRYVSDNSSYPLGEKHGVLSHNLIPFLSLTKM